ncbi:MAG: exo-alpha-sialidase [Clostridia bacterium]|nr:exo-alpha-sialidase [Clostridia bacterium]
MEIRKIWDKTEQEEYALCRIPGILVTSRGTLIIYGEARKSTSDWALMDIVMCTSENGGVSFSAPIHLARGTEEHPTVNNPVMAEDACGKLHFLYCEDYGTCGGRILHRTSADDGKTFGKERDITHATLPEYRNVFALGPGHGICTSKRTLVFPFWLVPKKFRSPVRAHTPSEVGLLCSMDGGKTWRTSELLRSGEEIFSPNESVAAELPNGEIYLSVRHNAFYRAHAVAESEICAFREFRPDFELTDPICFGSVAVLGEKLLFVNCENAKNRKNITLKASTDGGKTWSARKVIDEERGGYADIAADTKNGKIYILYENNFGAELYLAVLDEDEI